MESQRLTDLYTQWKGEAPAKIELLPGAGSNRKYYRLTGNDGGTVIGVEGTSEEEDRAFIEMSRSFSAKNFNTPHLYAASDDAMVYLQEDLGSDSLFDFLKEAREKGGAYGPKEINMLSLVISELPKMQFEGGNKALFAKCYPQPEMDATSVMFDLNYFKYNFLKLVEVEFNEFKLQTDFENFVDSLLTEDADTFLYRDFQARNVMLKNGMPYFIDYQGGRRGPIYYDVASFLWQASAKYSDELRKKLINEYYHSLEYYISDNECPACYKGITKKQFTERLHQFVLFRILQVLGSYGYRGLWEKKKHFIVSIPPALDNLQAEIERGTCDAFPYMKKVCLRLLEAKEKIVAMATELEKKTEQKPATSAPVSSKVADYLSNDATYLAKGDKPLVVRVYSFSYKKGIPQDDTPNGGGYVFDCRSTHNPGRYAEYKQLTGLDKPVIDFLEEDGEILTFLDSIYKLVDFHAQRFIERGFTDLMISCGCTGGRHRSVYSAQHIAEHLNEKFGVEVRICHREQGISQILPSKS